MLGWGAELQTMAATYLNQDIPPPWGEASATPAFSQNEGQQQEYTTSIPELVEEAHRAASAISKDEKTRRSSIISSMLTAAASAPAGTTTASAPATLLSLPSSSTPTATATSPSATCTHHPTDAATCTTAKPQ